MLCALTEVTSNAPKKSHSILLLSLPTCAFIYQRQSVYSQAQSNGRISLNEVIADGLGLPAASSIACWREVESVKCPDHIILGVDQIIEGYPKQEGFRIYELHSTKGLILIRNVSPLFTATLPRIGPLSIFTVKFKTFAAKYAILPQDVAFLFVTEPQNLA